MFAEIIINSNARALNRIFDYIVPEKDIPNIKIGTRVFVPFGNSKKLEDGFVIGLKASSEFANKEIVRYENGVLTEENIELAKLMAQKYFCNISDTIKLMLAPGTSSKEEDSRIKEKMQKFAKTKISKQEFDIWVQEGKIKSDKHIKVIDFLLQNGEMPIADIEKIFDISSSIVKTLEKYGYIEIKNGIIERNPFINKKIERDSKKNLNDEQQKAYDTIDFLMENEEFAEFLIHGITGSRKNRNIFTINRKSYRTWKNSNSISTRNITYTTNGR